MSLRRVRKYINYQSLLEAIQVGWSHGRQTSYSARLQKVVKVGSTTQDLWGYVEGGYTPSRHISACAACHQEFLREPWLINTAEVNRTTREVWQRHRKDGVYANLQEPLPMQSSENTLNTSSLAENNRRRQLGANNSVDASNCMALRQPGN